jgi:hypothetical protein
MYTLAYKDDAAWNESRWQNERFNELLLQAKSELDDTPRRDVSRDGDAGEGRWRHRHPVLQQLRLRRAAPTSARPRTSPRAGRCDGARAAQPLVVRANGVSGRGASVLRRG